MNNKCPKCKKGYLELDTTDDTIAYCDVCGAEFEAKIIGGDDE